MAVTALSCVDSRLEENLQCVSCHSSPLRRCLLLAKPPLPPPANRHQASAQGHGRDANHLGEEEEAPEEKQREQRRVDEQPTRQSERARHPTHTRRSHPGKRQHGRRRRNGRRTYDWHLALGSAPPAWTELNGTTRLNLGVWLQTTQRETPRCAPSAHSGA